MPRLTIKREDAPLQFLELHTGVNRFGRCEDNDFQIDDPTVSSVHAEVRVDGDSVVVRDLGSSNGTFINGEPVKEESLQLGEILALGEVEMVLEPTPVSVSIPQWEEPKEEPVPTILPDGSQACLNHASIPAVQRCTHCQRVFCNTCVHHLRRAGGKFLDLCPVCSHRCEILPGAVKSRKRSIFSRLQETLKLSFKR